MARLPIVPDPRQPELFARADLPTHIPRIEFFAERERRRQKRGAASPRPIMWEGVNGWVRQLGGCGPESERHGQKGERFARIAQTISVAKVRECRDAGALARAEEWLAWSRNNGLDRALPRAVRGELLAEVRNRIAQLKLGREKPRTKGPRLDPAAMPTEALERLIQRHKDMELVERMRAELRARTG